MRLILTLAVFAVDNFYSTIKQKYVVKLLVMFSYPLLASLHSYRKFIRATQTFAKAWIWALFLFSSRCSTLSSNIFSILA